MPPPTTTTGARSGMDSPGDPAHPGPSGASGMIGGSMGASPERAEGPPPRETAAARARRLLPALVALLAALPQLLALAGDLRSGTFPGSEYLPRVKGILDVSRVAVSGGPAMAVPTKDGGYEAVDWKVNDLGTAALSYAAARVTGRPATRRLLLLVNLLVFAAGVGLLVAVTPGWSRAALAVPFLLTPLVLDLYRSPDPLASHGALALLGIGVAAAGARPRHAATALVLGVVVFAAHKVRSAYALYTVPALALAAGLALLRTRDRRIVRTLVFLALAFAACEVPWRLWAAHRARDPRVASEELVGTHNVWVVLLEGVAWSQEHGGFGPPNRWGLRPFDPWMGQHLADHYGVPPRHLASATMEDLSRRRYLELWREDPAHLLAIYAGRLPDAVAAHTAGGVWGLAALVLLVPLALRAAWVGQDVALLAVLAAAAGMFTCLAFQTVVLDSRLIYAYPQRPVSLVLLSLSAAAVAAAAARGRRAPQ